MLHITEAELLAQVPGELYINGRWVPAAEGGTLRVFDPATGKVIKTIADARVEDGAAAVSALPRARRGPGWLPLAATAGLVWLVARGVWRRPPAVAPVP